MATYPNNPVSGVTPEAKPDGAIGAQSTSSALPPSGMAATASAPSAAPASASTTPRTAKATSPARKRKTTSTSRSRTTARKATAKAGSSSSTAKHNTRTTTRARTGAGDYAERAVLIPVGAALIARERVTAGVNDVFSIYTSSSRIEAQLRRFERRGNTARHQLEREVRKTRTRLEREMRQRRREIMRRRSRFGRDISGQVEQAQKQIEKTQTWFEDTVRTSLEDGGDLVNRVQERVLNRV